MQRKSPADVLSRAARLHENWRPLLAHELEWGALRLAGLFAARRNLRNRTARPQRHVRVGDEDVETLVVVGRGAVEPHAPRQPRERAEPSGG